MTNLIGVLRQIGDDGIVELDRKDESIGNRIFIPRQFLNGAPYNMKVMVEKKGVDTKGDVYGSITEVIGEENNPDVAILSIMKFYDLPEKFPLKVIQQVESFGKTISSNEIDSEIKKGRIDLRDLETITIDGEDAKDLDDAIDIKKLTNGNFRLYVHIADVSHYVKENSPLDLEANKRGNSIYLVDRVIPMYPPQLSNGICSLNPNQDRFALTADMEINQKGKIVDGKLYPSIIKSKVRTSYHETQAILDGEMVASDRPSWFSEKVFLMKELTDILQKMRIKRGALEFEFPETKIDLDEKGHPVKIYAEPDLYTNHLIESFMIAANEFTAEIAEKNKIAVLYRVHELPDVEKLNNFKKLAKRFNIKLKISEEPKPIELAAAIQQMKDEPYSQTLSTLLLRTLAKARYTEKNLGHFGLASHHYCHFTAPIRRYSDTLTHRNLKLWLLENKKFDNNDFEKVNSIGEHVSETERTAIEVERDTVDQKAAEYYADKIGEIYKGKISGFSPASLFVQLESSIEGALFYRTLEGYYEYDPEQLIAINRHNGDILAIGQDVTVQVASVDINRRFIDFTLINHATAEVARNKNSKQGKYHKKNKDSNGKTKRRPKLDKKRKKPSDKTNQKNNNKPQQTRTRKKKTNKQKRGKRR
ncbi:MAG: ribonuclease R [Clostridiaceae bacterium]|nr:ribonuclease R [Clostridiaceae bacterium]